jgi:hypothetical protein
MKNSASALQIFRRYAGVGMVVMVCGSAFTAQAQDRNERLRRFEVDRQACLSGKSSQTFDSCMKEARAEFAEPPGSSPPVSSEQLQRNAQMRCEHLTGEYRTACLARMRGEGTVSGSVAGGGILRELVTTEVLPANPQ